MRTVLRAGLVGIALLCAWGSAGAVATFEGTASFDLTLVSVMDAAGAPAPSGWSVDYDGYLFDSDALPVGDADASTTIVVPGMGTLGVGDTFSQSSTSKGTARNGSADSYAYTNFDITVSNNSGDPHVHVRLHRTPERARRHRRTGRRRARLREEDVLDSLGLIDVLLYVEADALFGPLADSDGAADRVSFTLLGGETNVIYSVTPRYVRLCGEYVRARTGDARALCARACGTWVRSAAAREVRGC